MMLGCRRLVGVACAALLALLAVGCGGGTGPGTLPSGDEDGMEGGSPGGGDEGGDPAPTDGARVRLVHAAVDAPAVDVYVAGSATPLATDVAFPGTSAYASLPAGTTTLELRPAGAPPDSAPVASTGPLALVDGDAVTVVAAGLWGSTQPDRALRLLPLVERFREARADGARLRVVNASADAPALGLDVEDDGLVELPALGRFADSGEDGLDVPAGRVLPLGVRAEGAKLTAFQLPTLPAGTSLFAIPTGLLEARVDGQRGLGVLLVGPQGTVGLLRQAPFVYLLHAVPDAAAVDVFTGDTEVVSNLAFGKLSARLQLPPGTHAFSLYPTSPGTARPSGAPLAAGVVELQETGETYLVEAVGLVSPDKGAPTSTQLLALQADFGATSAEGAQGDTLARVRVVHAVPDASPLDFGWVDGTGFTRAVRALPYLQTSPAAGLSLPAPADVRLGVSLEEQPPLATFPLSLAPGERLFGVAAGRLLSGKGGAGLRLLAVQAPPTQTVGGTDWTVTSVLPSGT